MNILAISHLFPTVKEKRYGIFVPRQLSEMAKLGARITVLVPVVWCPDFMRRFPRWREYDHHVSLCPYEGLETHTVPFVRLPGNWYNRWSGISVYRAARKLAGNLHRKKRFDVIYATDFFPDGDAAVRLGKDLEIPATCLGIGVDVNITAHTSKAMNRHFINVARNLDGTLACGKSVADGIDAVTGGRSLCVYGVIDLKEFCPAGDRPPFREELKLPRDKQIILYAGYLARRKGVYELVEAFDAVQKQFPEVFLAMCGIGGEEQGLRQLVRDKNLEQKVRFAGDVPPENMSKWMKAADLFVLASYTEGMPNVVMEAMACGLPVVATAVGGLPDAVGDTEGAVLVPPQNVNALRESISKIVGDRSLAQRMGNAGKQKAEENFGVERNARRILEYLTSVVENKSKVKVTG